MLRFTARWLFRTLLYSLASALVLFAMLLTGLRYLLPQIPDVTKQVEQLLAAQYQVQADVGTLSADWSSAGPELVLHDVRLQTATNLNSQVSVDEARVQFNFWQSVTSASLQFEQVNFSGLRLQYDLRDTQQDNAGSLELPDTLLRFLLTQLDHVEVSDSVIELVNLIGVKRSIQVQRLSWMNRGARHQGVGELSFTGVSEQSLDLIIDVHGNDPQALSGQFYVAANQVDITPWLQQQIVDTQIQQAEFNFTMWLNFAQNSFTQGLLELGEHQLAWRVGEQQHHLRIPSGQLQLQPEGDGWLVNSSPMTITHNQQQWLLPTFSWQQTPARTRLSANKIPLAPLLQLANLLGSRGVELSDEMSRREVGGELDIVFDHEINQPPRWYVRGQQLAWQEAAGIPGLQNAELELHGTGQQVSWHLHGQDMAIQSAALHPDRPWPITALDMHGRVDWGQADWQVEVYPNSYLGLPGMQLAVAALIHPTADSVMVNAHAESLDTNPISAETLRNHLPLVMGDDLHDYLSVAIQAAQAQDLAMVWRGTIADFPYINQRGVFQARARVSDLVYQFQPDWRPVYDAEAVVEFHNERMHIVAEQGLLGDVQLPRVDTIIANIIGKPLQLDISASIQGDSKHLQPVFEDSPLADSLGATFTQLQLTGAMQGTLQLTIPFGEGQQVIAEGAATLTDNQLYVASLQQQFEQVNGTVSYRNDEISAEDLSLTWQGFPNQIDLRGQSRSDDYFVQVKAQGDWALDKFAPLAMGTSAWQADFNLSLPKDGGYSFSWNQSADLSQVQLDLPAPLTKPSGQASDLQLQVSGSSESLLINAELDDSWLAEVQLNGDGSELRNGYMRLGKDFSQAPNPNVVRVNPTFTIDVNAPAIKVDSWLAAWTALAEKLPAGTGDSELVSVLKPDLIQLVTPDLTLLEHQFTEVAFVAWPENGEWRGRLTADQTSADLGLVQSGPQSLLQIDADYLALALPAALAPAAKTESDTDSDEVVANAVAADLDQRLAQLSAPANFNSVPNIKFSCERCRYGPYDLGRVAIAIDAQPEQLTVQEFRSDQNNHTLAVSGFWRLAAADKPAETRFTGRLDSDDFGRFLQEYEITSMVKDSGATFIFDLGWQGAPYQYNSDTLNGEVNWRLGQGYLNEVSDRGARLFSLLSLDSILRKLRFDFRDVFANGLFYTSFAGDFNINQGVVNTDNTRLEGAAGDMEVRGSSNLVNSQLDYNLQFVPKVTSSLPVILAWMINPPSGLAALVIDRMLHDAKVISRLEYKISGTIDQPEITEVARSSRDAPIPQEVLNEQSGEQPSQQPSQPSAATGTTDGAATEQSATATTKPATNSAATSSTAQPSAATGGAA